MPPLPSNAVISCEPSFVPIVKGMILQGIIEQQNVSGRKTASVHRKSAASHVQVEDGYTYRRGFSITRFEGSRVLVGDGRGPYGESTKVRPEPELFKGVSPVENFRIFNNEFSVTRPLSYSRTGRRWKLFVSAHA